MNAHGRAELDYVLIKLISETNGVSLGDTLELATHSMLAHERPEVLAAITDFRRQLFDFQREGAGIDALLDHPVAQSLASFLAGFPMPYREEHIHLSGSLDASFVYPRLVTLLDGPDGDKYEDKIRSVYGENALPLRSEDDVDRLIRLRGNVSFERYLRMLTLPKLVLIDRRAHEEAAYHMASTLFERFNVGSIRLKFSISRRTSTDEALPGNAVGPEDIVLGLYEGFERFRREQPGFEFILSPCFRKEVDFYDKDAFPSKKDSFHHYVETILALIEKHPFLRDRLCEVDTVGDERDHYRKRHFDVMRLGFRKLQFRGFSIRSHHGETWRTLQRGVQAVDNAMNIWHINTLEHGVSLGVNPNYYFHMIFERVMAMNFEGQSIPEGSRERAEIEAMDFQRHTGVRDKLFAGQKLDNDDIRRFIKTKFHMAREVEHYQHDVLNRMIDKGVSLVALPSSNIKLTSTFPTYKDHPFSWWEKKGVNPGGRHGQLRHAQYQLRSRDGDLAVHRHGEPQDHQVAHGRHRRVPAAVFEPPFVEHASLSDAGRRDRTARALVRPTALVDRSAVKTQLEQRQGALSLRRQRRHTSHRRDVR